MSNYDIKEAKSEKSLVDLKLSDLEIKKGKSFCIEYNFDNFYYFDITIDDFIIEDNNMCYYYVS